MFPEEILDAVVKEENLEWAWQKVLKYYKSDTAWRDDIEIAAFETNLKQELNSIAEDIKDNSYINRGLKLIPQPKKEDEEGNLRVRQFFWVSVRDQVTWVAVVNIIGPILDSQMPKWSFGNRLYRSTWYDDESGDGVKRLKIGHYRHTTGLLYRKFNQGWPLYRRYIYLTLKRINRLATPFNSTYLDDLDEIDNNLLEVEANSDESKKLEYLTNDYWINPTQDIYWASIDFEKYYPNLKLGLIKNALIKRLSIDDGSYLKSLIEDLLDFSIEDSGFPTELLVNLGIDPYSEKLPNLPTGLMVAGFLANCAMLDVDDLVSQTSKSFQVAHFRYVDDHVVLANDFNNLVAWLKYYQSVVNESGIANINIDKTVPVELKDFLNNPLNEMMEKVKEACWVDPIYPKPLMTKTLNRVSQLASLDFEFLDDSEQAATLNDLELLLLADINDSELSETTRVSFAATLISRFTAFSIESNESTYSLSDLNREIFSVSEQLSEAERQIVDWGNLPEKFSPLLKRLEELKNEFDEKSLELHKSTAKKLSRSFSLLMKAIHENPEKLRLWQRAIDFCVKTGFNGIKQLQSEVQRIYIRSEIVGLYIQSLIYSYLAQSILIALSDIETKDLLIETRLQLIGFVEAVLSSLSNWENPEFQPYYFKKSFDLLLTTSENTTELLTFLKLKTTPIERAIIESQNIDNQLQYFENRKSIETTSSDFLSLWTWWADSVSTTNLQSHPSGIWKLVSEKLDIRSDSSWFVWMSYPKQLPKNAQEAILDGSKVFPESYNGWLVDAMADTQLFDFNVENALPLPVSNFLIEYSAGPSMSLYKWVKWACFSEPDSHFDPRVSEWTCLEIVKQIIQKIISKPIESSILKIHPANIYIPFEWMQIQVPAGIAESKVPTWESWKRTTNEHLISFSERLMISDFRYKTDDENEWAKIQALALILLGLLKKDFLLPSFWNNHYQSPAVINSHRIMIGEINCSSLTSGILDATLLPWSRESFLISLFQNDIEKDTDTTYDPPPIYSFWDFLNEIDKAQKTLEKYQFSVSGHKPIQLVPMHIEQFHRYMPPLNQLDEVQND